ncbi:MAG: ankyrin repeat domain-containing protein [Gammaproteobacteria bacterium]|nr:ankyrin repeat domain-containing protein [Gammaproteobacteria bacterium]
MRLFTVSQLHFCLIVIGLSFSATNYADDQVFLRAVELNDARTAEALILDGADVNATQVDGATALHWAAHWDQVMLANQLIAAGAKVNATNELGIAPLSIACRNGSNAMANLLLSNGASPRTQEPSGETALMTCARTGTTSTVLNLLTAGANPNAKESESGQTALMLAASEKQLAAVRALIDAGGDVNAQSIGEFTPLMFAARAGALEIAFLLLEAGASVNSATSLGLSPLLLAAASLDAITGSDYRLVVEESDHEALGMLLVEYGADVSQADQYGMTSAHYAVEMNKPLLLKALLDAGADPNAQLTRGLPFRRGDYVGREAYDGASPFWLAARLGNVQMMKDLLAAGADPELRQAWGVTPLMVAAGVTQTDSRIVAEEKLLEALTMLALEVGADIHATDRGGQTAVHGAANISGNELIKFLVAQGADPEAIDRRGRTPHDVAMRTLRPRPVTAALLRELAAAR